MTQDEMDQIVDAFREGFEEPAESPRLMFHSATITEDGQSVLVLLDDAAGRTWAWGADFGDPDSGRGPHRVD